MLKFFDFSSNMGRLDFFKSCLFRGLIAAILFAILIIIESITSINLSSFNDTLPSATTSSTFDFGWEQFVEASTTPGAYIQAFITGFINLLIFGPIDLRRANDLNMGYEWILPLLFLFILPAGSIISLGGIGVGLWVLISVYRLVINLILLFKPGQTFKEWVRAK